LPVFERDMVRTAAEFYGRPAYALLGEAMALLGDKLDSDLQRAEGGKH